MQADIVRRWTTVIAILISTAAIPGAASAQTNPSATWTREVSAAFGLGHVFRYEDQTFGDRPNISGAVAIVYRARLGVELEVNRTLGLSPSPAPCGIAIDARPAACVGRTHNGVRSATVASVLARYQFTRQRVRPYVTAGLGVLRSTSVWSSGVVEGNQVILTETEMTDVGFGPDLGAGIRVEITRSASIRPEVRWLEASFGSRLNLAVTRLSVRAVYFW
jgi:hypothetical protein